MATVQCKMCGGAVELPQDRASAECPYCGTLTTFPRIKDDHTAQMYARAEHHRRAGDFDKAMAAYEAIAAEDGADAEASWGLTISRYGIEYVEDPATHERIPTCHRVQYESILADPDYRSAIANSTGREREIYEKEAHRIAEIQRGILAISANEKPFDVFICYKETTEDGSRTQDSVIAQDIYYQLRDAGYNVFFSRITLEDKLGREYEPYIFAALNSAKVMLVIGTRKEHFTATWVRNEWSRFLALMKKDRGKLLIPCYRDMDPYDLPEDMSLLQSQDMSKIGFIQDLLHGIEKVVAKKQATATSSGGAATATSPVAALLERTAIFLKTFDFDSAAAYCEKILDVDPKNAQAYLLRLLATRHLATEDDLVRGDNDFEKDKNFVTALEFADATTRRRLLGLVTARKGRIYDEASALLAGDVETPEEFEAIAAAFESISGHLDADELAAECRRNADVLRFNAAVDVMEGATSIGELRNAAKCFEALVGKVDGADELCRQCTEGACAHIYKLASTSLKRGDYGLAAQQFESCCDYEDAATLARKCRELDLRKAKARTKRMAMGAFLAIMALVLGASAIAMHKAQVERMRRAREAAEAQRAEAERQRQLAQEAAERAERARVPIRALLANMVTIPGTSCKMCRHEVTQELWEAVMGSNPSHFKGPRLPVDSVSWMDCIAFIGILNKMPDVKNVGVEFRLPTELEWDTACRAGESGDIGRVAEGSSHELGDVAWYLHNSGGTTHPVGQKTPNAYGLYDIHGNVCEWTMGERDGKKINRGGGFCHIRRCSAGARFPNDSSERLEYIGLRLACDMTPSELRKVEEERQRELARNANVRQPANDAQPKSDITVAPSGQRKYYVDSKSNSGAYIGTFRKGDILEIRFLSGTWTVEKGDMPYVSPDDPNPKCDVKKQFQYGAALACKTSKGITAIPTGTATAPFVLVIDEAGDYMIRMRDTNLGDNDGAVQYSVTAHSGTEAWRFLGQTKNEAFQGMTRNVRGGSLTVRSWIDGGDYVLIQGGKVWFVHRSCDLPGVNDHRDRPLPTYVNGTEWRPRFDGRDEGAKSDAFPIPGVVPSMVGAKVWLRDDSQRGHAHIIEQPYVGNGHTLKVELGDHGLGASWCEFTVHW